MKCQSKLPTLKLSYVYYLQDAHTHILSLPEDTDAAFFAVYDGHGGPAIAKYAANNLHKLICEREEYKNGDISGAFSKAFLEIDEIMLSDNKLKNEIAGTTAVTCLVKGDKIFCGNVGDSRAVACISGVCCPLSYDHKPSNPLEEQRIREAGGWIEFNRVNGNLALSRALGDFSFKRNSSKPPSEQMVTASPDIEEKTMTESWEFILLACDGIWDVLTNEEAIDLVRYALGTGMTPDKVCEDLLRTCLAPDCQMGGLGCDNMTVILVCLLNGQSWGDYCSKIASALDSTVLEQKRGIINISDSDDDEVIPSENLEEAKSAVATLCNVLSNKESRSGASTNKQSITDSVDVRKVLQSQEYVHSTTTDQAGAGEVVSLSTAAGVQQNSSSGNSPARSNAELLEVLNSEMLEENQLDTQQQQQQKKSSAAAKGKGKPTSQK